MCIQIILQITAFRDEHTQTGRAHAPNVGEVALLSCLSRFLCFKCFNDMSIAVGRKTEEASMLLILLISIVHTKPGAGVQRSYSDCV